MSEQLKEPESWPPINPSMTREKAIELLQETLSWGIYNFDPDYCEALKFAIKDLRTRLPKMVRGTR